MRDRSRIASSRSWGNTTGTRLPARDSRANNNASRPIGLDPLIDGTASNVRRRYHLSSVALSGPNCGTSTSGSAPRARASSTSARKLSRVRAMPCSNATLPQRTRSKFQSSVHPSDAKDQWSASLYGQNISNANVSVYTNSNQLGQLLWPVRALH